MSIDILKGHIKDRKFLNLYLFYGPEEYLKKYYIDSIEKILLPDEGLKPLNKTLIEGKTEVGRIIDCCETLPAFAGKRLMIVKNSGILKTKAAAASGEGKGKSKGDELQSYLQNIPDHICLIFYEEEVDKRLKTVDIIKKQGLIVEFPFQKPAELVKWVMKVLASYKKHIDPAAASLLVENSEQGMNEILSEINKLSLYVGDRDRVSEEDIAKVCVRSIKTRIFDLTDAIAEKDGMKALKLLEDMIVLKEPLPRILFMITRHFRHMLQLKILISQGIGQEMAATRMGITPYAASKTLKQSRSFTIESLKEAIEQSLEYDIAIKTGRIKDRVAAELLIAKLST